jgi:hypothetical protein
MRILGHSHDTCDLEGSMSCIRGTRAHDFANPSPDRQPSVAQPLVKCCTDRLERSRRVSNVRVANAGDVVGDASPIDMQEADRQAGSGRSASQDRNILVHGFKTRALRLGGDICRRPPWLWFV